MFIYCYLEGDSILRPKFLKFTLTPHSNVVQISIASALLLKAKFEPERERISLGGKHLLLNPIKNVKMMIVDNPKDPKIRKKVEIDKIYINCKLKPYENLIPESMVKDFIEMDAEFWRSLDCLELTERLRRTIIF